MNERVVTRDDEPVRTLCAADLALAEAVALAGGLTFTVRDDPFKRREIFSSG